MDGSSFTVLHPDVRPLSPELWPDFEKLFGANGACGGCWCMWWKLANARFKEQKGEGNRRAMETRVMAGETPGLILYRDDRPAAWCAVEPRSAYPRMARSRILKPVDDRPVWSVSCFFTARKERGRGHNFRLLAAAVDWVRLQGGRWIEGYPVEPAGGKMADPFVFHGLASTFQKAGFSEIARRSPTRPIMRLALEHQGEGDPPNANERD
jgi:GNAT superfamily N-acetyltransferase